MDADILSSLFDIGISLIVALIGWEIIPMNTPENKKQWWDKIQPFLKWGGSVATVMFTILLLVKLSS
ncbi:MAG: hypothetical protein HRU38_02095 [Saccharospirillaceae bacterium]|nr:hypothetical protein [Pseudomonadales bacterium]NRB77451.1 hypothetical protein [Saccharospirillaceae bacterium]